MRKRKKTSIAEEPHASLYKEQRVGVFVDVQNLYYSAKFIHKAKVNYKNLLKEAIKGRNLIRAIAYVIKADVKDEANFFDALKNFGYEVKAKDLQIFYGGAKKGDWDIGIAMDLIELASRLDATINLPYSKRKIVISGFPFSSFSFMVPASHFFLFSQSPIGILGYHSSRIWKCLRGCFALSF
jgi:hypothetical protein